MDSQLFLFSYTHFSSVKIIFHSERVDRTSKKGHFGLVIVCPLLRGCPIPSETAVGRVHNSVLCWEIVPFLEDPIKASTVQHLLMYYPIPPPPSNHAPDRALNQCCVGEEVVVLIEIEDDGNVPPAINTINLINDDGVTIRSLNNLTVLGEGRYARVFVPPSEPFVFQLLGTDENGYNLSHISDTSVETPAIDLTLGKYITSYHTDADNLSGPLL